jgi:hypothetical protein
MEPHGPIQTCNGIALPLPLFSCFKLSLPSWKRVWCISRSEKKIVKPWSQASVKLAKYASNINVLKPYTAMHKRQCCNN